MKKIKRLSIEFRHREVTISVAGSALQVQDGESDAVDLPTSCPTCGSPWIIVIARAAGDVSTSADLIHRMLLQTGLHVQAFPAGRLRICQKSFEELKEKF